MPDAQARKNCQCRFGLPSNTNALAIDGTEATQQGGNPAQSVHTGAPPGQVVGRVAEQFEAFR